jgi:hypothetical protein
MERVVMILLVVLVVTLLALLAAWLGPEMFAGPTTGVRAA